MADLIIEIFLSIIPPVFAILTALFSSTSQFIYIEKKISIIVSAEGLDQNIGELLKNTSIASITLLNFITTSFSCLLSIIIIFLKLPKGVFLLCSVIIILLALTVFQRWIWDLFSLRLDEISTIKPCKRKATAGEQAFYKHTYAQLFNRRQYYFNMVIILIIVAGYIINASNSPPIPP